MPVFNYTTANYLHSIEPQSCIRRYNAFQKHVPSVHSFLICQSSVYMVQVTLCRCKHFLAHRPFPFPLTALSPLVAPFCIYKAANSYHLSHINQHMHHTCSLSLSCSLHFGSAFIHNYDTVCYVCIAVPFAV